jgi:DNA-binding transcriptional LysR family regulator
VAVRFGYLEPLGGDVAGAACNSPPSLEKSPSSDDKSAASCNKCRRASAITGSPVAIRRAAPTGIRIARRPCTAGNSPSLFGKENAPVAATLSLAVPGRVLSTDAAVNIQLARDGYGLTVVYEDQVRDEVARGDLVAVLARLIDADGTGRRGAPGNEESMEAAAATR